MKINVFYSWQSDLPNKKNRGLINDCIKNALNSICASHKHITEIHLESDSRNEIGTPDLASTIFSKIDVCDIFIADISIINSNTTNRLTPNPNVLIELGYASKSIGWTNILCIYNTEFGEVEKLPFDIRHRKPVCYNTAEDNTYVKKQLIKSLELAISEIIEKRILDKKEFLQTKRQVDLGLQAILIDFCKLLYKEQNGAEKYNYVRLLHSTHQDIRGIIDKETFMGFELFKNIFLNISEFTEFFKDEIETFFLSSNEKRLIAKTIYALRAYKEIMLNEKMLKFEKLVTCHKVVSGKSLNPSNAPNSYLLIKEINQEKGIVVSSGNFENIDTKILLNMYTISEEMKLTFVHCVHDIITLTNDWIRDTGNYFIYNLKAIEGIER
ncbi:MULTISPECIES: hypothetical protein [Paenibacillus]|uniref:hypothetical protein n=1 Tax=Paenibacillus TaxID=44249 RepID=UPI00096DC886|nr:hypothetical protein [Paenibacillus odorifer]OME34920.1 hypothetical protein BSK58_24760 [Paenibacillus odorifer]